MPETSSEPPDLSNQQNGLNTPTFDPLRRSATTPNAQTHSQASHHQETEKGFPGLDEKVWTEKTTSTAPNGLSNTKHHGRHVEVSPPKPQGTGSNVENDIEASDNMNDKKKEGQSGKFKSFVKELKITAWAVLTHSWINVLLVFVPAGIVVAQIKGISGGVVFAINAVAIIPLAGLLSFATEAVARKMGDAVGALLNVTFGNAVELIIL